MTYDHVVVADGKLTYRLTTSHCRTTTTTTRLIVNLQNDEENFITSYDRCNVIDRIIRLCSSNH